MAVIVIANGVSDIAAATAAAANGDSLVFATGSTTITSGYGVGSTIQALTEGLGSITASPQFSGNINSGSIACDVDNAASSFVRWCASGGEVNFGPAGDNSLIIRFVNASNAHVSFTSGTFTTSEIACTRPHDVAASAVMTNLYHDQGVLNIQYNATVITAARITGGAVNCQRGITSAGSDVCVVSGGTLKMFRDDTTGTYPPVAGILRIEHGSKVIWAGGNINVLEVWGVPPDGCPFDATGANKDFTITTLKGTKRALAACKFFSPAIASQTALPTGANLEVRCGQDDKPTG